MVLRRPIAIVALLLLTLPALAASRNQNVILTNPPGWVFPQASFDCIFSQGKCWQTGKGTRSNAADLIATTRATPPLAYAADLAGNYFGFAPNIPRLTNAGVMVEEARTNDALWARDMTNAAWVKDGLSTALNAAGIDGAVNSATTLTATGTAGSCASSCAALQTVTLGSSSDTYSVFLKRVTGSGAVNVTINNLVGTTACTLVTTAFTRCSVTATLANPVFGVQLTVLNDVVVADFNQTEPGGFATTPISTTTVAVVRAADAEVMTVTSISSGVSLYTSFTTEAPASYTTNITFAQISDGTNNNRIELFRANTTGVAQFRYNASGVSTNPNTSTVIPNSVFTKIAVSGAIGTNTANGTINGALVTPASPAAFPVGMNKVYIGNEFGTQNFLNGSIPRIAVSSVVQSSRVLQQITSGPTP